MRSGLAESFEKAPPSFINLSPYFTQLIIAVQFDTKLNLFISQQS